MKKLKKVIALLLTAVMALAMLTACGGGSGSGDSRTEKERYVDGINDHLNRYVSGYSNNLKYDSGLDQKAKDYQNTYESLRKNGNKDSDAKELARKASGMSGKEYVIVTRELGNSLTERERILLVANAIQYDVGDEYLAKYQWNVSYAWGAASTGKQTVPIYIVLYCLGDTRQ